MKAAKTRSYDRNFGSFGRYLEEVARIPTLSREEEEQLIAAAQEGDRGAFDQVIQSNLKHVIEIAREYHERDVPMVDIVSEGNLGLFRAMESFDLSRGMRFITYAKWWIRHAIGHAFMYKGHLVRLPQSQLRKLRKKRKQSDDAAKNPEAARTQAGAARQAWSETDTMPRLMSIHEPVLGEGNSPLLELIPNEDAESPDESLFSDSFRSSLELALSRLNQREATMVRMLFGFDRERQATLKDVAQEFGISKERVRQIKDAALEKLRRSVEVRQTLLSHLN